VIPKLVAPRRPFPIPGIAVLALAAALMAPSSPALAADPGRGGPLYQKHCSACHGATGSPVWPGTPDFRRPEALMKSDSQLLGVIRRGRGVMPGYLGIMRERELMDLVAYLRTLS
jgi:cytochrome c6